MRRRKWLAAVCAAVLAFGLAACKESASIGIIGGADGPTAIFWF